MWENPYIKLVLFELETLGHNKPKVILFRYYKVMKRTIGFYLNAKDFASEIHNIDKAVNQIYNPSDPNQVYIGHMRDRLNNKKKN